MSRHWLGVEGEPFVTRPSAIRRRRIEFNFRMQATAGGLRCGFIEGQASAAAPDPER
jgi:hypothetical protein